MEILDLGKVGSSPPWKMRATMKAAKVAVEAQILEAEAGVGRPVQRTLKGRKVAVGAEAEPPPKQDQDMSLVVLQDLGLDHFHPNQMDQEMGWILTETRSW